jgi:hypothetical protein
MRPIEMMMRRKKKNKEKKDEKKDDKKKSVAKPHHHQRARPSKKLQVKMMIQALMKWMMRRWLSL